MTRRPPISIKRSAAALKYWERMVGPAMGRLPVTSTVNPLDGADKMPETRGRKPKDRNAK
jgi:hypothetical protein